MAFDLRQGIADTAAALGMDPVDLATLIHYESGLNPDIWGGAGGRHYGAIQFGPAERNQYGVVVGQPESQFGPNGAIVKYMLGRGFKPGMSILDAYSTINAGSPGRYNASDAGNGGQPGNVRDKVTGQMADDRVKAQAFMGGGVAPTPGTSTGGNSPYSLHARHPQNPQVGAGGYVAPGAPTTEVPLAQAVASAKATDKDKMDKYQEAFSGAFDSMAGMRAPTMSQLPQMPTQAPLPMDSMPIVSPSAAGGGGRDQLAMLMQQLNSGRLWG